MIFIINNMTNDSMLFIRSLLFFLGQVVITVVYFPLTLLAYFLPVKKKVSLISGWGWIMIKWLNLSCGLDYKVSGLDNLPAAPFIALVKHQSAWETMSLLFLLPPHSWVLKKELLRIPIFGWGLALAKPIAIDRSQSKAALKQLLQQGKDRLEDGLCVVICPEGTRMAPGVTGKFNAGGSMLASQAKVPIVPIAHNSGSFWQRKGFIKRPGTIQVVIGEPIDSMSNSASEMNAQSKQWIEQTVEQLEAESLGPVKAV